MWTNNTAGSRVGIKIAGGLCGDGTFLSEKQKKYYHRAGKGNHEIHAATDSEGGGGGFSVSFTDKGDSESRF